MFKKILYNTFGLRDGEIAISFLMQLYIFIIITVLLIVKPTVNALFLNQLGADNLPQAYLLVALVAVIISYFYNKLLKNNALVKISIYSLIIFSLAFLGLSYILHISWLNHFSLYFYYLFVSLFAVIATSQFWMFANMVYNSREAKRLFGFIGAGAIAGGVFGGYLTSYIANNFGNKILMILAAILILFCIPILQKIYKLRIKKLNIYIRRRNQVSMNSIGDSSLRIILKSKHLTYLALITGVSVIVAKLVDFQFSDFANKAFNNSDDLASFFGFWFSSFNLIALLIQLLLTNKVLAKLGVSSTLLILPFGIALGGLLFLTFPELWVLIIIKGLDGSFKQSINKAAFELSIMPIPLDVKNQAKSFIDVAVDSIATGIAGFLLIFLIRKLNLSTNYITVIIILFVLIWIALIFKLREAYFNSFRENIKRNLQVAKSNSNFGKKKETSIDVAKTIFETGNTYEILALLDRLADMKLLALKQPIINLLQHDSNKVKISAIEALYNYPENTAVKDVEALLLLKDDELVVEVLEYLLNHTYKDDESIFNAYLNHKNDYLSNAILLCLAKDARNNEKLAKTYNLEERIEIKINDLSTPDGFTRKEAIGELLITIAYSGISKFHSFIAIHLNNQDEYIVNKAIIAAGLSQDEQFIATLLTLVKDKSFREEALNALKNYGYRIVETLLNKNKLANLDDDTKKYIPRLIRSFDNQNSISLLVKLLINNDIQIRLQSAKALAHLKDNNNDLFINYKSIRKAIVRECRYYRNTITIKHSILNTINKTEASGIVLEDASTEIEIARREILSILDNQEHISLKTIFKLLTVMYNTNDIEMSYNGLLSNIQEAKVNALEFLDNLLQQQLKVNIFPLLEQYVVRNEGDNSASYNNIKILNEKTYLKLLVKSRGKRTKLEVINLILHLNIKDYATIIKPLLKHKNTEIKYLTHLALKKISGIRSV